MMEQWTPVGLLGLSLVLLWISTRQLHLGLRLVLWLGGALALTGAIWTGFQGQADSLAATKVMFTESEGERIVAAFNANWATVASAVTPMLALFALIAILIAVAALLALTPGQAIERLTRPVITMLVGAMIGSALALSAMALGFGGYLKPRSYVFFANGPIVTENEVLRVGDVTVVDGDTLRIGDASLRLDGIDAPEHDQICVGRHQNCGPDASRHLATLLEDMTIVCERSDENSTIPPEEAFGRPIVKCTALSEHGRFDVGARMKSDGFASDYVGRRDPIPQSVAVNGMCTVHPRNWRQGNRDIDSACVNYSADPSLSVEGGAPNSDNPR